MILNLRGLKSIYKKKQDYYVFPLKKVNFVKSYVGNDLYRIFIKS